MRWACLFLVCFITQLYAQDDLPAEHLHLPDDQVVKIGEITLSGNKVTRDMIILREVEFKPGDELTVAALKSRMNFSRNNLMNRALFNFVTFTPSYFGQVVDVHIEVTERWYIWPIPILNTAGRNLNAWLEDPDPGRLNYGIDLRINNFRGRMEVLNFVIQGGYDQTLSAKWSIPYLNEKQFLGAAVGGGYQRNHQIAYQTLDNKPVFYEAITGYAQQRAFADLELTMRPQFNFLHTIGLGYEHYIFQDTLLQLNPRFAEKTRYDFFTLSYTYKHDYRDYKPYPLVGYYFDIGFLKQGLGILQSDLDYWTASFTFDHYINIHKRWYFAYSLSALSTSTEKVPYFLTSGFGYPGWEIRGYELYFIDGQDFGLFKSNFKFEIIPPTKKRIKWIRTEKFGKIFYGLYANVFFDLGYAQDGFNYRTNPLANQLLWGTGVGIDFITYYDLVIRFEAALNKQGETGFFLNLVAPI